MKENFVNKLTYFILNGNTVVVKIYEDEKWGRTMVVEDKVDFGFPVELYKINDENYPEKVRDIKLIEFFLSMLE